MTYEREAFRERFVTPMLEDDVAVELTAVSGRNLCPGGTAEQGPVINLFQTETVAHQQHPDAFGVFPGLGETPDRRLSDRGRVADIIDGGEA